MSTCYFTRISRCTVALSCLLHGTLVSLALGGTSDGFGASTGIRGVRGSKARSLKLDDNGMAHQIKDIDDLPSMFHPLLDPRSLTSKNSGSPVESFFDECASSCEPDNRALTSHPSCCSGGLSALKIIYHGPSGSLSVPNDRLTESYINTCEKKSRGDPYHGTTDYVRFADCGRCFPATNGLCDVAVDTATTLDVTTGTEVCLVLVDLETNRVLPAEIFPTNTKIFFGDSANDVVLSTTIHTSCSKPIYPPFGVRIGSCIDDENYLLDLSISTLPVNKPVFEFVDGSSRNNPDSLFSNCSSSKLSSKPETCCSGGASYIKARLMGDTVGGSLTINPALLPSSHNCDVNDSGYRKLKSKGKNKGKKKGKSSSSSDSNSDDSSDDSSSDFGHSFSSNARFVHCDDECLSDPFNVRCSNFLESQDVGIGEEFCIISFDSGAATFSAKLPTNVFLWFVPEIGGSALQSLIIHTSCSRPLIGFAQTFGSDCDALGSSNVDLSHGQLSESTVYIEFVDGISTTYFDAALGYDSSSLFYDISFADCGCTCPTSPTTSRSLGPSTFPSGSPSLSPSIFPSILQSDAPSSSPSDGVVLVGRSDASNKPSSISSTEPFSNRPLSPAAVQGTPRPTEFTVDSPSSSPSNSNSNPVPLASTVFTIADSPSPSSSPSIISGEYSTSPSENISTQTARPSEGPSLTPSIEATGPRPLSPARPPSTNDLTDEECSTLCADWVLNNCIRVGDNGDPFLGFACDVSANDLDGEGRRWMRSSPVPSVQDHKESLLLLQSLILLVPSV